MLVGSVTFSRLRLDTTLAINLVAADENNGLALPQRLLKLRTIVRATWSNSRMEELVFGLFPVFGLTGQLSCRLIRLGRFCHQPPRLRRRKAHEVVRQPMMVLDPAWKFQIAPTAHGRRDVR
jgi:hypothetical protein